MPYLAYGISIQVRLEKSLTKNYQVSIIEYAITKMTLDIISVAQYLSSLNS